jgi:hypothetical protein
MIVIRCKECGVELTSHPTKTRCCGCSNMTTVRGETITALDLSKIVMVSSNASNQKSSVFSNEDLEYQNARRNRKVRRLDFEVR